LRCVSELCAEERFAAAAAREVRPEADPDLDDVPVPVEVPERLEAVVLVEHGAAVLVTGGIAHRSGVVGVRRGVVEVPGPAVTPRRPLAPVGPAPLPDPQGTPPPSPPQRAAASSPRRAASSSDPPRRKPAASASPAPVGSTTSVSTAAKSSFASCVN